MLKPSPRPTPFRFLVGTVVLVIATGATTSGAWVLGGPLIGVALFVLAMSVCIVLLPRSYELHLDERGFVVHDIFGRPAHVVAWSEVALLVPVLVNASFLVVAFVCDPRRPKQGRLRWRRGTRYDDGCMPDHYGRKPEELIAEMEAVAPTRLTA